jgi:hypothetical protein
LNQLINVALAEKLAVMEEDYWRERRKTAAKRPKSDTLNRLAGSEPPGTAMPSGRARKKSRHRQKFAV